MIKILAYRDFPWVVSVVEEQKSFREYPRKNAATAMDPNTTATHPTRRSQVWEVVASPKYFHPWRLVRLQNSSNVIILAKFAMFAMFILDLFRSMLGSFWYFKWEKITHVSKEAFHKFDVTMISKIFVMKTRNT